MKFRSGVHNCDSGRTFGRMDGHGQNYIPPPSAGDNKCNISLSFMCGVFKVLEYISAYLNISAYLKMLTHIKTFNFFFRKMDKIMQSSRIFLLTCYVLLNNTI